MAPAKCYPGFPKRIFGLKCSQHRVFKMRDVLGYYRKKFGQRASKERLLKLLVNLEGEVNDAEKADIQHWLSVELSTARQLTKLLNTTRGIVTGDADDEIEDGHEPGDNQPIMTCTKCHFKTCFIHKMPWHAGQTCHDYDDTQRERLEQEAASDKRVAETTKKCPNARCRQNIEKNGGCDHMTCKEATLLLLQRMVQC
jgi:IBR domain, a half RING-finger domain